MRLSERLSVRKKIYFVFKRLFDIILSALGIVVTLPIWILTIVGIELSDAGPIFYRAKRIGKDNKEFIMWKFRTMRVAKTDAEKSEASFKADTNRIFKFGEFCRRTKIDELPQLLNIFFGTMSIVGPRPAAKDQVEIMREGKYNIASFVKPGLTGPAALYDYIYGDEVIDPVEYEEKVLPTRKELEAFYPSNMSMIYDIKMMWYTIVCVIGALFKRKSVRIYTELVDSVSNREKNTTEVAEFIYDRK